MVSSLALLEQLEGRLAQEPTSEVADAGRPTPRVCRLWLIARLCGEDADVHLLVYRLVDLVANPRRHRMAAWLAELGDAVERVQTRELEAVGEVRRLLSLVSRLLEQPEEVRTAAAKMLTGLTLSDPERDLVALGAKERSERLRAVREEGPGAVPSGREAGA